MYRAIGLFLTAALFASCAGPAAAAAGPQTSPSHGDFAGQVEVGDGRSLYMECRGEGSPTVILEAGLRSRSDFWSVALDESTPTPTVFPGIAEFTRVCAYDRPGTTLGTDEFSRSTPVPMPRTARDAVEDLHLLLRRSALEGPFVLVGHSTGGLITRLYATKYPKRVGGLVQVDALSEFLEGPFTRKQMAAYDELNNGPIEGLDYPDLEQVLFRRSFEEMRRAADRHPLEGVPVTVISRALPLPLPDGLPAGLTTRVAERAWAKSQDRLARLTPRTRRTIAKRSSHYVMFSQPGLIIRAVERMGRSCADLLRPAHAS